MVMKPLLGKVQTAIYLARMWRHASDYIVNNGAFWDQYVRVWERSDTATLDHVGDEWSHPEEFRDLLRKYASPEKDALEIGSGGGRITSTAVGLFRHVYACDVSSEMLRKAQESVKVQNASFHKIDGFTLANFPNETMDFVYSHDVFVHFSSLQVYPYFFEIKRVLKPGGMGLISFRHFVTNFDMFKSQSLRYWGERRLPPHMRDHFVTEEMIGKMLDDAGLELVEMPRAHFLIVAFRK